MIPREKVRESYIVNSIESEDHADQIVYSLNARNAYQGIRFEVDAVPACGEDEAHFRIRVFHLARHSEEVRRLQAWAMGYLSALVEAEEAEAQADDSYAPAR